MSSLLYGVHDRDAQHLIPAGGWCVDAVLVTDTPPNYQQIRGDINWIVRLNHGWYPNGTIPMRGLYGDYANRCADFVRRCPGVDWFVISNEPNHEIELPYGVRIQPEDYADCFNACYAAIKTVRRDTSTALSASVNVCVAAIAPWDITSGIDWLVYYRRMLDAISDCDGLAVHGYTHGAAPSLISSTEKVHGWFWHFPVIYQTIEAIPPKFARKPVHVTETNQGDNAWLDINHGWVKDAYANVNAYNQLTNTQKILSLSLYRWRGDKYEIFSKSQVQDDFRQAVAKGYFSPMPTPPQPPIPDTSRDIDPALIARGVTFAYANPAPGTWYWRIVKAEWLDEQEADAAGPDHHILGTVKRDGVEVAGVPLRVTWPSDGSIIYSKSDQPNASFNYDFPMSASLNEFGIHVIDGNPSDRANGIGMGAYGNPGIHTSTWIDFQWTIAETEQPPQPPTDPDPPQPPTNTGALLWPVRGPVTQRFGEPPARFGQAGHNGIDIACPLNTPVVAIADGEVMFAAFDENYGNYIRCWHPSLRSHSFVAHLSRITCTIGQQVKRGQTLGLAGSTGNSTGPHCHFELRGGTREAYVNVTYGYTSGRYDPVTAYLLTGSPLTPGG